MGRRAESEEAAAVEANQLSNTMTGALLSYVRRVGGEEKVSATLQLAGERRSVEELCNPTRWGSYDQAHALFSAAVLVMNDPDVGRWAGQELVSTQDSTGIGTFLGSLNGPSEVIRLVSQIAAKSSTVTDMEALEVTDESALVSAITKSPITRDKIFCSYTAGVLSLLPHIFGMDPAEVTEIKCQTRGDARCLYKVTWDPSTLPVGNPERHIAFLKTQIAALTHRIESLEITAADLVSESEIDDVLHTITMRASMVARGQKYLLAVRLPGDQELRIHHVGFTDIESRIRAAEVLASEPDDIDTARLVVDVASNRHHFGRLAVFYPEGYSFLPQEHRQLRAYAGHAAAALETAAALDEARRRGDTLSATLGLATSLAEARTSGEVAETLAQAITTVVECDQACVLIWEPRDEMFVRAAFFDAAVAAAPPAGVPSAVGADSTGFPSGVQAASAASRTPSAFRSPQLSRRFARSPEPMAVERHTEDTALGGLLALTGLGSAILVPIVTHAEVFGVVAIGSANDVMPPTLRLLADPTLSEKLSGVANIAAPALKNALLLAQVQYEALHDPLTGLPNTRLLQEEIVRALSHAERQGHRGAVLFVDLDHFGNINDVLGHVAADDVLRAVGLILRSAVRRGDVVARLAGDQFAVLLPNVHGPHDAELVANKIISALQIPLDGVDDSASVSASIGVAVFPEHGHSYDDLLGHADCAMRLAKAAGGGRLVLSTS